MVISDVLFKTRTITLINIAAMTQSLRQSAGTSEYTLYSRHLTDFHTHSKQMHAKTWISGYQVLIVN